MPSTSRDAVRVWMTSTAREAAWAPVTVFLLHVVASTVLRAYESWPALDIPMHLAGGAAIALFFHRAAWNASRLTLLGPFHPVTHGLLVFSLCCASTVFWEFAEFLAACYLGSRAQLGLEDTLFDMFLGIVGGGSFVSLLALRARSTAAPRTAP